MQINTSVQYRLLSVSDYYMMTKNGIFKEEERLELINGQLFNMPEIDHLHADCLKHLTELLVKQADSSIEIRVQKKIYFSDFSEVIPDIVIVKEADYHQRKLVIDDILLIIEVADSNLYYDRTIKLPLFADYQLPEIWLVDIDKKELNIYQQPFENSYRSHCCPKAGELVQPLSIESINLDWQKLFVN